MTDDGAVERVRKMVDMGSTPPFHDVERLLALVEKYQRIHPDLLERLTALHTQSLSTNEVDLIFGTVANLCLLRENLDGSR